MMQLVLLGTGTPNACYFAQGPSAAIVVNEQAYIVDFGPGVVRQASHAYYNGIDAMRPDKLDIAFCTHLHSDHTVGLADLLLTPWVLERKKPLRLLGPKGLQDMVDNITKAYEIDIDFRKNGEEKANHIGYLSEVTHIQEGCVYEDENIKVEALRVEHGSLECYAFKFIHDGKTIVISGDTCPLDTMVTFAKDADILLHEVEYSGGLKNRTEQWQIYHQKVHTLSKDLANIAKLANVKKLITTHRIYHMNMLDNTKDILQEVDRIDNIILDEIYENGFHGDAVNGKDLDVFTV